MRQLFNCQNNSILLLAGLALGVGLTTGMAQPVAAQNATVMTQDALKTASVEVMGQWHLSIPNQDSSYRGSGRIDDDAPGSN